MDSTEWFDLVRCCGRVVATGRSLADGFKSSHLDESREVALERATGNVPVQLRDLVYPEAIRILADLGMEGVEDGGGDARRHEQSYVARCLYRAN